MGSRKGGFTYKVENVRIVEDTLKQIAKVDLNPAKRDLRQGTKDIANERLIPALKMSAYGSGVPIAPAMADTMRTRTDRMVTVRVGAVNPKLRGFKSGIGEGKAKVRTHKVSGTKLTSSSQSYRTTLAFGSDRGPYPGSSVNHYKVSRSDSHWVKPGLNAPGTFKSVRDAYIALLRQILRDYGEYR